MESQAIAELITILTAKVDNIQQGVDQAIGKMKDFENTSTKSNQNVGLSMLDVAAKVAFVVEALKVFNQIFLDAAAKEEAMSITLGVLADNLNLNKAELADNQKAIEGLGFTAADATGILVKFARAHMDTKAAVDLARVAMDYADSAGKDYGETLNELGQAVLTGNTRALRDFGVSMKAANQFTNEFAASLGKSSGQLTRAELSQAALNFIMQQATDIAGEHAAMLNTVEGKEKDIEQSFKRSSEEIGGEYLSAWKMLLTVVQGAIGIFEKVRGQFVDIGKSLLSTVQDGIDAFVTLEETVLKVMTKFHLISQDSANQAKNEFNQIRDNAFTFINDITNKMSGAATAGTDGAKKVIQAYQEQIPTLTELINKFTDLKVTQKDFADDTMPDILKKTDEYMKMQGLSYQQQIAYLKDLDKRYQLSTEQRAELANHVAQLEIKYNEQVAAEYSKLMTQGFTEVANAAAQSFTAMVGDFQGSTINIEKIWEQLLNKLVQEFLASGLLDLLSLIPGLGAIAPIGGGLAGGVAKAFGFDDPANDALARAAGQNKWFQDFSNNFSQGYVSSAIQSAPSMPAPSSASRGNFIYNDNSSHIIAPADRRAQIRQVFDMAVRYGYATVAS